MADTSPPSPSVDRLVAQLWEFVFAPESLHADDLARALTETGFLPPSAPPSNEFTIDFAESSIRWGDFEEFLDVNDMAPGQPYFRRSVFYGPWVRCVVADNEGPNVARPAHPDGPSPAPAP